MSKQRNRRDRYAEPNSVCGIDLYDYCKTPEPKPRGRPIADDLSDWRVVDDWPDDVPVTPEEVDIFERWFGDLLDEMFGPESGRE